MRAIVTVGLAVVMVVGLMGTGTAGVATTSPAEDSLAGDQVALQTELPEECWRSTGPTDGDTADCWVKV